MLITSAMMTWYKSNTVCPSRPLPSAPLLLPRCRRPENPNIPSLQAAVILQWVNQTFNATTNYTNRNASSPVTTEMLAQVPPAALRIRVLPTRAPATIPPPSSPAASLPFSAIDTQTQAYVIATICSVTVAVGLNKAIARSATLSRGIIGRFVPLTAIAAANCINIPMMRQVELKEGIAVATAEGVEVGTSKAAALSAVAQVLHCP